MLPPLENLSLLRVSAPEIAVDGGVAIGAPSDEDLQMFKLLDRPAHYVNDVARLMWGRDWWRENKDFRKEVAKHVLVFVFPDFRNGDRLHREITPLNRNKFVDAVKRKLGYETTEEDTPPPPPQSKKNRINTTPNNPNTMINTLSPELLEAIFSEVVRSGADPCSALGRLCVSNREFAKMCRENNLYAVINVALGWKNGGESARDIFKNNCIASRLLIRFGLSTSTTNDPWTEVYGLPIKRIIEGRRRKSAEYIIVSDLQKRLFLRYYAVSRFFDEALETFFDQVGLGVYGEVGVDGAWEEAGITEDASDEVRIGRRLHEPLKEQYTNITEYWKSKGILDLSDVPLLVLEDQSYDDYKELFDDKYQDIVREYRTTDDTDEVDAVELNLVLDNFVAEMLAESDDDGSGF